MEKSFEIEIDNHKIEDYEYILSRFSNWKKNKREINLNLLLEQGKKIQFDVEFQNNQRVLFVSLIDNENTPISSLTNACAAIKKMTFIILNNDILKLNVEVKFLTTLSGKNIKQIIESGLELKLFHNKNIEGKIDSFYFKLPNQAA